VQDNHVAGQVNALTKLAADKVGLRVATPGQSMEDPFGPDALKALRDAGLCENFIQLINDMLQSPDIETFMQGPRFMNVVSCIEQKSSGFSAGAEPSEDQIFSIVEDCFCAGSGSLFVGLGFTRYSAPRAPGGGYTSPNPPAPGYSSPSSPAAGYSSPSSAGGQGYSSPSL
jgi:hypothetical protein